MSAECVDLLQELVTESRLAAGSVKHAGQQLERLADFTDGMSNFMHKWFPRIAAVILGSALTASGGGEILKILETLVGHK